MAENKVIILLPAKNKTAEEAFGTKTALPRVAVAKTDIHCINSNAVDSLMHEGTVNGYGGLVIFLCGLSS
ncbi:MAG: hypothetical protein Q8Q13_03345 [bacterium]|nr:hypothetical protein [bacterium]